MKRYQIENLYIENGLSKFRLTCVDDILKCHGIDFQAVKGYNELGDIHKVVYEKFLVNYLNSLGMDLRMGIQPTGIFYVEDTEYLAQDPDEPEYIVSVKRIIKSINRNGTKKIIHTYIEKKYSNLPIKEENKSYYFRIEYKCHGKKEWLHINNDGNQWY